MGIMGDLFGGIIVLTIIGMIWESNQVYEYDDPRYDKVIYPVPDCNNLDDYTASQFEIPYPITEEEKLHACRRERLDQMILNRRYNQKKRNRDIANGKCKPKPKPKKN